MPDCTAVSRHVPAPLVIVTVLPLALQEPEAPSVTGKPDVATGFTEKELPKMAAAGTAPKLIVCEAMVTVSAVVASEAARKVESPAKVYVMV